MPLPPWFFPHLPPTSREDAEFSRDAAASAAPRPARWDDPYPCSTAAGTTSPLPRTPPAGTATAAAGSSSPAAPDWSAGSGWPSTPGLTHHFSLGFLGFSWKIQDMYMMLCK